MAVGGTPARTQNSGNMGVLCRQTTFAIGDGGDFEIGVIPAGYVMDKAASGVTVEEVFNAGTTNTVDIGYEGATAAFASGLSLLAKDFVPLGLGGDLIRNAETRVLAKFSLTGTAATTGKATFTIKYNRIENS